jgi:lipopolysaccharide export system protein LptA
MLHSFSTMFLYLLTIFLSTGALLNPANAAKDDQFFPTAIESDKMTYDELKQINTFTGNVRLIKGSLILKGDTLTLRQTPEGFQMGFVEGKPAFFRQRRDGPGDLYVEGFSHRIDYDGKTETVILSHKAELRKLNGPHITDEVKGEKISYQQGTEFFTVNGSSTNSQTNTPGRVKVIIQPREQKGQP